MADFNEPRATLDEHSVRMWTVLAACAGWEHHRFADGPLAQVLMHVVTDPAGLLRGDERAASRASVRLRLRDGVIFGAVASAPRTSLLHVLQVAAAALAGRGYDESVLNMIDTAVASALMAAGLAPARITLEHNATLLPRPVLPPDQVAGMALHAVNAARRTQGGAALPACPPLWLDQLRQACALDDPAVQGLTAALDTHVLDYCSSAREVHGIALDRLAVHNVVGGAPGRARNRTQAMRALPWVLPLLTTHDRNGSWEGVPVILRAIDAGLPLHDAVATAFGVPREVVRWLSRRTLPGNWSVDACRLQRLLALLAWLPPERRPRDHAQLGALTALGGALVAPLLYRGRMGEPKALERIAACMRHWLAHATQGGSVGVFARGNLAQQATALEDAKDFLRALFEAACAIDGLDEDAADAWVLRWCAGIGAARLLVLSRAWHAEVAGAPDEDADGAGALWPSVMAGPWHGESRTVIELTSRGQLHIEGRRMGHCVGSYEAACRSGNSVIVSLRTASGEPVSTAELHLRDDKPAIVAGQHRAARNGAPGPDCTRALAALLQHLNHADQRALACRRAFQRRQRAQGARRPGRPAGAQYTFSAGAQRAARRLATPPVAVPANLVLSE
jgi:hypothetical protein